MPGSNAPAAHDSGAAILSWAPADPGLPSARAALVGGTVPAPDGGTPLPAVRGAP